MKTLSKYGWSGSFSSRYRGKKYTRWRKPPPHGLEIEGKLSIHVRRKYLLAPTVQPNERYRVIFQVLPA